MRRSAQIGATLVAVLAVGGCADLRTALHSGAAVEATGTVQPRRGENTVLIYHPRMGFVRGTRSALAGLGARLEPAPGPNHTIEACRAALQAEAGKLGAREVEAVSAGPERRNRQGQTVGPVHVRITYERLGTYEVREAKISCVVDGSGKVVGTMT